MSLNSLHRSFQIYIFFLIVINIISTTVENSPINQSFQSQTQFSSSPPLIIQAQISTKNASLLDQISENNKSITGLFLTFGEDSLCPTDFNYTELKKDLNAGAGGDFIYLCYTRDFNAGPPITSIEFLTQAFTDIDDPVLNGYNLVPNNQGYPADLNQGIGTLLFIVPGYHDPRIFMFYSTNVSEGQIITNIELFNSTNISGWNINYQDLNQGVEGEFIYLGYQTVNTELEESL